MPKSRIKLIDFASGDLIAAAPENSVLQSSAALGWRGLTVELHNLAPTELPEHFVEGHRLMVAVQTGKPISFEWKEKSRWKQKILKAGDFSLQTHGEPNAPRWFEKLKILAVAIEPKFIGNFFRDSIQPEKIAFRERRCETDATIARFAAHFKAELENNAYTGKLYGESLAMAFSLHLLEQHGDFSGNLKLPHGKLAASQLRRTIEFVHENLAEDLSIEQIASQAYVSAFHFARLFRNTLGLTPHQYVLQSRLERAKRLMKTAPRLNLTEIGLSVGFFDQAHFTKTFKRATGATPKNFLKNVA
jgi:AraC family transcriptional regulator